MRSPASSCVHKCAHVCKHRLRAGSGAYRGACPHTGTHAHMTHTQARTFPEPSGAACFCLSRFNTSVASKPALLHSCLGMTSSAFANALMKSCDLDVWVRATSRRYLDSCVGNTHTHTHTHTHTYTLEAIAPGHARTCSPGVHSTTSALEAKWQIEREDGYTDKSALSSAHPCSGPFCHCLAPHLCTGACVFCEIT